MTDAILPKAQSKNGPAEITRASGSSLKAFITRLHFYVGLFVGPFILIAAITGTLYVLTPQLEDMIYRDQLCTSSLGTAQPLADQVKAAGDYIGEDPRLFAIRPPAGSMPRTLIQSWLYLRIPQKLSVVLIAAVIGWALPMIGLSLIAFC